HSLTELSFGIFEISSLRELHTSIGMLLGLGVGCTEKPLNTKSEEAQGSRNSTWLGPLIYSHCCNLGSSQISLRDQDLTRNRSVLELPPDQNNHRELGARVVKPDILRCLWLPP